MTIGIYDINTHPKCIEFREVFERITGENTYTNIESLIPGFVITYYKVNLPGGNYYGELIPTEFIDGVTHFFGKMSMGCMYRLEDGQERVNNFDKYYIYVDYPDGNTEEVGFVLLIHGAYDINLAWCGCNENDIACGDCCVSCCELAISVKDFYENILS